MAPVILADTGDNKSPSAQSRIKITALVGPPSCGKSTLLGVMSKAATLVCGTVFCDMSEDIIEWHKNPVNASPLMNVFIAAETDRSNGNLLNDDIINAAVTSYIEWRGQQVLNNDGRPLENFVIAGWPRTPGQFALMESIDDESHLTHIRIMEDQANQNRINRIKRGTIRKDDDPGTFARRWEKYHKVTEPEILKFRDRYRNRYVAVNFNWHLPYKAELIMRRMRADVEVRTSLIKRIHETGSDAHSFIKSILEPVGHASTTQELHAQS